MSRIIGIVIAVLLAYSLVRFCIVKSLLEEAENARRTLSSEVQTLREETGTLSRALDAEPDAEQIEKLARDRLGLVMPNETIYYFTEEDSTKQKEG